MLSGDYKQTQNEQQFNTVEWDQSQNKEVRLKNFHSVQ